MKFMWKREKAASVTELGLMVGLIAVIVIGAISATGTRLNMLFGIGGNAIDEVATLANERVPNSAPQMSLISGQMAKAGKLESFSVTVQDNETTTRLRLEVVSSAPEIIDISVTPLSKGIFTISYKALAATSPVSMQLRATDHRGLFDEQTVTISVEKGVYKNCLEAYQAGWHTDGVYQLDVDGEGGLSQDSYQCDMTTDGGGWTIIQNRESDTNFYQNWAAYKAGFGTYPNFWLGNDKIHALTTTPTELYVELERYDHVVAYAKYASFSITDESDNYRLSFSGYSGTAGDSLSSNGYQFSTYDADHDGASSNCAVSYIGAWWYSACHASNLNGDYGNNSYAKGLAWYAFGGHYENHSMIRSKMMVR